MWEFGVDRSNPSVNAGFAGIDFLSATYETDDGCPVLVAIHAGDQEFRLGLSETSTILLPVHEVRRLLMIPCALCFVKNDNMLSRWVGVDQSIVPKVMHVLNECFDTFSYFALAHSFSMLLSTCDFIPGERLTQYGHEGTVPGEEYRVSRLIDLPASGCKVEANQRLASPGNSGDEADDFTPFQVCHIYEFFDPTRSHSKVLGSGIVACDCLNRMLGIE
jgi:hypothetical protein